MYALTAQPTEAKDLILKKPKSVIRNIYYHKKNQKSSIVQT